MKRLNELFAMNGQVGFLASQRVDGRLILQRAGESTRCTSSLESVGVPEVVASG